MRATLSSFALLASLLLAGCTGSASAGAGGGSAASSSSASSSSTASTTGATGAGGATGGCTTCDGGCVDTQNDPRNCGACGHACGGSTPLCDRGACAAPPCDVVGAICPLDHLCCGMECCPAWKICCNVPGSSTPTCAPADAGACPTLCAGCQ